MRDLYKAYETPPGCHDVPFIYLYDATELTNGRSYTDLALKLDGDSDFILRRIAGVGTLTNFFAYRNASGSYVWQPLVALAAAQADISVGPEKIYPIDSQIRFDTGIINKRTARTGGTDYLSYIAFQGAKRFHSESQDNPCDYRPRSYQYVLNIPAVDWVRGQYKRFSVRIDATGDFELQRIIQVNGTNVPDIRVGVFFYQLYDPNRWPMMSAPVPDGFIIDQQSDILAADGDVVVPGVFPVPSMLYPRMSQIIVDLWATMSTPQGDCWQIMFDGVERIPLDGNAPVYS